MKSSYWDRVYFNNLIFLRITFKLQMKNIHKIVMHTILVLNVCICDDKL